MKNNDHRTDVFDLEVLFVNPETYRKIYRYAQTRNDTISMNWAIQSFLEYHYSLTWNREYDRMKNDAKFVLDSGVHSAKRLNEYNKALNNAMDEASKFVKKYKESYSKYV